MANCLFPYIEWPDQKKQPLEDAFAFFFPHEKREALLCKLKYSKRLHVATVLFLFANRCPLCGESMHRDDSKLRLYLYCNNCKTYGDVLKFTGLAHSKQNVGNKEFLDVYVAAAVGDVAISKHGHTVLSVNNDYADPEWYKEWEVLNQDRLGDRYSHGYLKSSLNAYIQEKIAMRQTLNKAYCEYYPEIIREEFNTKSITNGDCQEETKP